MPLAVSIKLNQLNLHVTIEEFGVIQCVNLRAFACVVISLVYPDKPVLICRFVN